MLNLSRQFIHTICLEDFYEFLLGHFVLLIDKILTDLFDGQLDVQYMSMLVFYLQS